MKDARSQRRAERGLVGRDQLQRCTVCGRYFIRRWDTVCSRDCLEKAKVPPCQLIKKGGGVPLANRKGAPGHSGTTPPEPDPKIFYKKFPIRHHHCLSRRSTLSTKEAYGPAHACTPWRMALSRLVILPTINKETAVGLSQDLTKARFNRRNALKAQGRNRGRRLFCQTPAGHKILTDVFLEPLAQFLAGKTEIKPPPPPADLGDIVNQLDPHTRAAVILVPFLDRTYGSRGWADEPSAQAKQCINAGKYLRDQVALKKLELSDRPLAKQIRLGRKPPWKFREHLKSDWTESEYLVAGSWMLECASTLDYFDVDDRGLPAIAPGWQQYVDQQLEQLMWRDPVFAPHLKQPSGWTGWAKQYDDRLHATFVRDSRPETKAATVEAFSGDFEHVRGVNALSRVPLRIDQTMLALVERFAVDVINHKGERREDDQRTVSSDLRIAKWIGDRTFYLDYNCDTRGRLNPLSHFNYAREDHVRSLFKFANGQQLKRGDIDWLEIHCANCEGSTDKKPWSTRQQWAADNRGRIEKIAADPFNTFELWTRDVDKPFAFVAACIELASALANPVGFKTHLPIGFDGSCNGLQHLAMLCRDRAAGERVNLVDTDSPRDIYGDVTAHILTELETDRHKLAGWWRNRLKPLSLRQKRKLLKAPVMTLSYNVKDDGMVRQMGEEYAKLFDGNEPEMEAARYLAGKIRKACEELLPGPVAVMRYITALTRRCSADGRFLEWRSPTGFFVSNRYNRQRRVTVNLLRHGVRIRHRVGDGYLPKLNKTKAANSAPANFVHSLDAAHLIRVVNAAMEEGISEIVCVHDSFACLATQAVRFNRIIRTQMAMLYARQDHLLALGEQSGLSPPRYGDLDPLEVQKAEYCFA